MKTVILVVISEFNDGNTGDDKGSMIVIFVHLQKLSMTSISLLSCAIHRILLETLCDTRITNLILPSSTASSASLGSLL